MFINMPESNKIKWKVINSQIKLGIILMKLRVSRMVFYRYFFGVFF